MMNTSLLLLQIIDTIIAEEIGHRIVYQQIFSKISYSTLPYSNIVLFPSLHIKNAQEDCRTESTTEFSCIQKLVIAPSH